MPETSESGWTAQLTCVTPLTVEANIQPASQAVPAPGETSRRGRRNELWDTIRGFQGAIRSRASTNDEHPSTTLVASTKTS
jgi:hypothetical protein